MEGKTKELAGFLVRRLQTLAPSSRLLVGLTGIPASGKSTLANAIVNNVNELLQSTDVDDSANASAILVGLDGWHFTRAQLDAFQDPKLAHDRRGIHWTFDAMSYVSFIRLLRENVNAGTSIITAPSFDHALKDPTPDAVSIHPHHRVVVIEGLYTLLSIDPWRESAEILDERWLLQLDTGLAKERLIRRHVASGVAKDWDEAVWRAENNDIPNGRFVLDNILDPTKIIESVEDAVLSLR